jgi:hypothetical protein
MAIDKITKGQVLTNRKDFKNDINTLRTVINTYRSDIRDNPFMNEAIGKNEILDIVDELMVKYSVTQTTISQVLQITCRWFSSWRRECNRVLCHTGHATLLKDRIVAIGMHKAGLKTSKELAVMYGVTQNVVNLWMRNDKEFGIHLDKAIAFRHAKI